MSERTKIHDIFDRNVDRYTRPTMLNECIRNPQTFDITLYKPSSQVCAHIDRRDRRWMGLHGQSQEFPHPRIVFSSPLSPTLSFSSDDADIKKHRNNRIKSNEPLEKDLHPKEKRPYSTAGSDQNICTMSSEHDNL